MSKSFLSAALSLAVLSLPLGVAHAQTTPAKPGSAATSAMADDEENSQDQKDRRAQYIGKAFERFDTNKDGSIDRDEFAVGLQHFLDRQKRAFNHDFEDADANHDGKLSRAEVKQANPALAAHFEDIDTNNDGFLTRSEIRASIREQQMRVSVEGDTEDDATADPKKP
jgi:Ca2+-binding EF-hand superfamily protein